MKCEINSTIMEVSFAMGIGIATNKSAELHSEGEELESKKGEKIRGERT